MLMPHRYVDKKYYILAVVYILNFHPPVDRKTMEKGFVYILRNAAMPGLLKIGFSVKVPTERAAELFTTGVPEPFQVVYYCLVENAGKLESQLHQSLSAYRYRWDREFFQVNLEFAVQSISALCKPEHEWSKEGYRPIEGLPAESQPALKYGKISISSRDEIEWEIKEMKKFVEAATQRSLAQYVHSLFYDSHGSICALELSSEVEPDGPIAKELLDIANETISQFLWFGNILPGKPLTGY